MSQEFLAILESMEKEKGINRNTLLEAVTTALLAASRRAVGPARELRIDMDPRSGKIRALANLIVVEKVTEPHDQIQLHRAREIKPTAQLGEPVEVEVTPKDFGRIAAQVFKQTISQNIRNIERNMVFDEFKDRAGTIVTGTVRRFEKSDVIVEVGKFEAIMPFKERVPTEDYAVGERIRAYVVSVDNTSRGPSIVLSRSHPHFIRKLFELEVSELHDKTVEIKAIAREAGYRTKLAVWSANDKVDPVGACVGIRGARVKNIVRELNNEKIDLFRWSPNIRELVVEALKPAKLKTIDVDEAGHRIKVTVDEENLSLAIGRRGQNVRLTNRLTGWEIDIQKEESLSTGFEEKMAKATEALAHALEIEPAVAGQIVRAGFLSAEGIAEIPLEDFMAAVSEVSPELLKSIHAKAVPVA